METERLKTCLATDYGLLRGLADSTDLAVRVPSCSEWTFADLVTHVAHVYLHKVETMRRNSWPDPWPPARTEETEVQLLERGYRELLAEFDARAVTEQAVSWYEQDQTVGFWVRRMAQETVVHRIDAELAAGVPSQPVPEDLALDGIDELLQIFLAWTSTKWPEDYAPVIEGGVGGSAAIVAGGRRWWVSWEPSGFVTVETDSDVSTGASADAELSASPDEMLRWLWRRSDTPVKVTGDEGKGRQLRKLLGEATQ